MAADSKTEKASPKKRRDERKKGHTFSSKDIISVVSILAIFFTMNLLFPSIIERLSGSFYQYINYAGQSNSLNMNFALKIGQDTIITVAFIIFPIMIVSMASGVIATGAQTKFLFAGESMKPKFSRLNPLEGIKRMFSMRSLIEVFKGTIKIVIIVYIIYQFFSGKMLFFSQVLSMDVKQSTSLILSSIMELVYNICMIFVFIAAIDYLYQWWDYEKQIKMSKQEVKEEYKQLEGDPQVKGKIKEKQRKMAMSRMMQMVPTADVVIKNPTHYAVALRYQIDKDNAPIVVAKGQDKVAQRIIQVAGINDVYILENRELTRAIYAATDINEEIPLEFYNAVAEVLALVYKLKEKQI